MAMATFTPEQQRGLRTTMTRRTRGRVGYEEKESVYSVSDDGRDHGSEFEPDSGVGDSEHDHDHGSDWL
jgi:hypothetical protein